MPALIAFALVAQLVGLPGHLTELSPGDPDTMALVMDSGTYAIAFGPGCEAFASEMDVQVFPGSGGVASLSDADGNSQCNVLIGADISQQG